MTKYLTPLLLIFTGCSAPNSEVPEWTSASQSQPTSERIDLQDDSTWNESDSTVSIGNLEQRMLAAGLVNIQEIDPTLTVELKYSSTDNFLEKDLYGNMENAYLQPAAVEKLALAQLLLRSRLPSYSLLIYDAVRPRSVQWLMWKSLDMPASEKTKFLSNPRNGSLHNYGAAVDLTIINEYGDPLDMGTPYDYIGELAYPRLEDQMLAEGKLTQHVIDNRVLLRKVMTGAGFSSITTEWWHFNACSRSVAQERYQIVE